MFWSPPEDDLDDHHELSLVKLLSFRPIGLSLALGYLFQESPHDFSPFRTSVTSQAALHEMRENWLLMIWPGPWNPWKCHSSPDQRNANSQHPWPWLTDSSCKKREVATRDMMPMKNYASKILQMFTTELTPISVEYWVMTLHKELVPSGFVTIQKSQTLTSCEKNCGIPPSGNFIQEILWSTINFLGTLFQFQTSPGILLMLFNSIQGLEVVVVYHFHQRKQAIYQSAGLPTPSRTCAQSICPWKKSMRTEKSTGNMLIFRMSTQD